MMRLVQQNYSRIEVISSDYETQNKNHPQMTNEMFDYNLTISGDFFH